MHEQHTLPGWMLWRAFFVLGNYQELRLSGLTRANAIKEVIAKLKMVFPDMAVSKTMVKQIVADWQPEKKDESWNSEIDKNTLNISYKPRPTYSKRGIQKNRAKLDYRNNY